MIFSVRIRTFCVCTVVDCQHLQTASAKAGWGGWGQTDGTGPQGRQQKPGGRGQGPRGQQRPGGRVQDLQFRKDLSTLNDLDACWFVAAWLLPALPLGLSSL